MQKRTRKNCLKQHDTSEIKTQQTDPYDRLKINFPLNVPVMWSEYICRAEERTGSNRKWQIFDTFRSNAQAFSLHSLFLIRKTQANCRFKWFVAKGFHAYFRNSKSFKWFLCSHYSKKNYMWMCICTTHIYMTAVEVTHLLEHDA